MEDIKVYEDKECSSHKTCKKYEALFCSECPHSTKYKENVEE